MNYKRLAMAGAVLFALAGAASAQTFTASNTSTPVNTQNHPVTVQFTPPAIGDGTNSFDFALTYNATRVTFDSVTTSNPSVACQNNVGPPARVLCFADAGGAAIPLNALPAVTITVLFDIGATAVASPGVVLDINAVTATSVNGAGQVPTVNDGSIIITAGAPDVSPNIVFNPTSPGGAITLAGAGATATGNIVATPSGGTGAATTTVGSCVFAANTASLATVPSPITLTFTGTTTTAQNIGLTCTKQVAAVAALLTCQENQSDGTPAGNQARTFNVTCPAAGVADVSPDLTYVPPSGGALTLTAAGVNGTGAIAITPAGGTGAATTTVGSCAFAANTATFASAPATLTFTGTTTTAQNLNLTCVRQPTAVTALLTCQENQSDGTPAGPQARTFNITCPAAAAAATPEFSSTPPGGSAISLNGTQGGPAATSQITVSNIEPGTTLTVTPSGLSGSLSISPGVLTSIAGNASQVFTVSCSTATVGTFSQTLTFTTNDPDDAETTVTFPVTCNIIAAGAGAQATAVPTLSPAGKLIAIFSMLGLGLLGFAVTRRA